MKAMKACGLYIAFTIAFLPIYAHAQWTEPVRISERGGCLYPQILAQGETLHVAYQNVSGGGYIGYVRSADGGETWSEFQILNDTVNTMEAFIPRILWDNARIMVMWLSYASHGGNRFNIHYSISTDNGLNWDDPQGILSSNWSFILYFSAQGNSSNAVAIFNTQFSEEEEVYYNVRSTDFGQSWSDPVELFRAAQGGRLDQAMIGSIVHFTWSGRYTMDEKIEIYYMRSTDDGISWSPSTALSDSDQFHSQLPAIAANNEGRVGLTWMDFKYAPPGATGDIFIRQSADSGANWTAEDQLNFDHFAFRSDIVVIGEATHVAWEDESSGLSRRTIYYIRSTDYGVSWSEPYWVDRTEDDSWNPALAASNGNVYVVWSDDRDDPGMGLYFSRYRNQTDIIYEEPIAPMLEIIQAYPNPFNSSTIITYSKLEGGEIEIYNIVGQKIQTLKTTEKEGKVIWDARDALGNKVSSGIYFARGKTHNNYTAIKLLYMK